MVFRSAKSHKHQAVIRFAADLAAKHRSLEAAFTLFGREKAPLDGGFPRWYVCAQRPDQSYRLYPDFIAQNHGKTQAFGLHGNRCHSLASWTQRQTRAVFRSSNNRMLIRRRLAEKSLAHPDMLDARLVATGREEVRKGVPTRLFGQRYRMEEFARYRYQVNTDSWGGLYWKLLSGSVVIELIDKNVPWVTWRHQLAKPYEHYVPATIGTVLDQIEWCRENDDECRKIAARGRKLARKELGYDGALRFAYEAVR